MVPLKVQSLYTRKALGAYIAIVLVTLNIILAVDTNYLWEKQFMAGAVICFSIQLFFLILKASLYSFYPQKEIKWEVFFSYFSMLINLVVLFVCMIFFKNYRVAFGFLLAFHLNIFFIVIVAYLNRES